MKIINLISKIYKAFKKIFPKKYRIIKSIFSESLKNYHIRKIR